LSNTVSINFHGSGEYMVYEINLTGVQTAREMHGAVKAGLLLPEYYGMNLDALWDCLTGGIALPCTIRLTGLDALPECMKARVDSLLSLLQEACAHHAAHGRSMRLLIDR